LFLEFIEHNIKLTSIKKVDIKSVSFKKLNMMKCINMIGKSVLIFDLETTGFPTRKQSFSHDPRNEYYDPMELKYYVNSRIVEVAWYHTESFSLDKLDDSQICSAIRKPTDFVIKNIPDSARAVEMHGINDDKAKKEGIFFSKIVNQGGLGYAIQQAEYIVAHNAFFDVFVLMSELYRLNFMNCFNHVKNLVDTNKIVCTMSKGKEICKLRCKYGRGLKNPTLGELYNHYYGKYPENAHHASNDVNSLMMISKKIFATNPDNDKKRKREKALDKDNLYDNIKRKI
jgi:DNA polymerase III epsilon subunit-like protein